MAGSSRRTAPYRNFNFRVIFGAAIAGAAAIALAGKLLLGRRKKKPRKPPPVEPDSGARPIEAVGTSTAGFVGPAPINRRRPARAKRRPRKRS